MKTLAASSDSRTRARVKALLLEHGAATAAELGQAIGLSPAAIRRHLDAHGVPAGPVESRYGAEGEGPSIYLLDPERNTVELKGPPYGSDLRTFGSHQSLA